MPGKTNNCTFMKSSWNQRWDFRMHLTVPIFGEYKSQEWQEPLIKLNPTHVVKIKSLTNATAPQTVLLMSLVTKHTSLVLTSSILEYFTVSLSAQVALWSIKLFQFAVCRENGKVSLILMQFCWETGGRVRWTAELVMNISSNLRKMCCLLTSD